MNMPKQLQNKPLTHDLVASMSAIVDFHRGNQPADSRDQVHKTVDEEVVNVTEDTSDTPNSCV